MNSVFILFKKYFSRAEGMAQWLRTCTAFVEGQSLVPHTHHQSGSHNHLTSSPNNLKLSCTHTRTHARHPKQFFLKKEVFADFEIIRHAHTLSFRSFVFVPATDLQATWD